MLEMRIEPIVSVIIPTYRGSGTIRRSIKSVVNQTYKSMQIIVVDDNGDSTEKQRETQRIVEEFPTVEYLIHKVNRNGSAARNTGIAHSVGKYIAFLDDDDVWSSEKIERQVQIMEQKESTVGIVYGPFVTIDDRGGEKYIDGGLEGNILFDFLIERVQMASSLIMVRREVLVALRGFDESFSRHQDWEMICRIAEKYQVAYAPGAWTYKYLLHRNSPRQLEELENNRVYYLDKMSAIINELSPKQRVEVFDYHYTFLAKESIRRGKLRRCVHWLRKTGHVFRCTVRLLRDAIRKILYL